MVTTSPGMTLLYGLAGWTTLDTHGFRHITASYINNVGETLIVFLIALITVKP